MFLHYLGKHEHKPRFRDTVYSMTEKTQLTGFVWDILQELVYEGRR